MSNKYGEILENGALKFTRLLPGPIERVWDWVINPEKRKEWFCGGEWPCRKGAGARFEFNHANLTPHDENYPEKYKEMEKGVAMTGKVLECDAPKLIRLLWDDTGPESSEVSITLSEEGDKVRLVLIDKRDAPSRDHTLGALGGWHAHLDIMVDKLSGGTPKPFWTTHEALVVEYKERLEN